MKIELLREVGTALYGPLWQTELARQLGFSDRQLRRWVAGEAEPPEDIAKRLRKLGDARLRELTAVLKRIT